MEYKTVKKALKWPFLPQVMYRLKMALFEISPHPYPLQAGIICALLIYIHCVIIII